MTSWPFIQIKGYSTEPKLKRKKMKTKSRQESPLARKIFRKSWLPVCLAFGQKSALT
jgi:hypothetical protein